MQGYIKTIYFACLVCFSLPLNSLGDDLHSPLQKLCQSSSKSSQLCLKAILTYHCHKAIKDLKQCTQLSHEFISVIKPEKALSDRLYILKSKWKQNLESEATKDHLRTLTTRFEQTQQIGSEFKLWDEVLHLVKSKQKAIEMIGVLFQDAQKPYGLDSWLESTGLDRSLDPEVITLYQKMGHYLDLEVIQKSSIRLYPDIFKDQEFTASYHHFYTIALMSQESALRTNRSKAAVFMPFLLDLLYKMMLIQPKGWPYLSFKPFPTQENEWRSRDLYAAYRGVHFASSSENTPLLFKDFKSLISTSPYEFLSLFYRNIKQ